MLDVISIGGIPVRELAARFGTPIFVYDEARIRDNVRRVRTAFTHRYPNTKLYYAIKANSHPAIAKIVRSEGCGIDAASVHEIRLAKQIGCPGEEIMFSGNFLSDDDLHEGYESGAICNLDDASLLPRLLKYGTPEMISFRVNPDMGKSNVGHYVITGGAEAKFGIRADHVVEAYRAARDAGITRFGVHMMAGSCVTDPAYFAEITGRLLDIVGRVHEELGIEFESIDLGGGLGIPYRPDEMALDLEKTVDGIVEMFTRKIGEYGLRAPRLMMEPGRYFVADAGYLLARVHAKKEGERVLFGCDAGMNVVPRVILYGAYHAIRVDGKEHMPHTLTYLTGQICEQTDLWGKNVSLPPLEIGDLLVMENMGAYCFVMSYPYNGRLRPAEVLVHDGVAECIRRAENIEDTLYGVEMPLHLRNVSP